MPSESFLQTHRSYLVNRRHVAEVVRDGRRWTLRLRDGTSVPVARGRLATVRGRLAFETLGASAG